MLDGLFAHRCKLRYRQSPRVLQWSFVNIMVALTFDDGEEYGLVAQFLPVVSAAKARQ